VRGARGAALTRFRTDNLAVMRKGAGEADDDVRAYGNFTTINLLRPDRPPRPRRRRDRAENR